MVAWFKNLLFEAVPYELSSPRSLTESLNALSKESFSHGLRTPFAEAAVGSVSQESVKLSRYRPFFRNDFKPYFIGALHQEGNRVILRGVFRMQRYVSVFMTFWLGFAALWTAVAALLTASGGSERWLPLAGLGMFGVGTAFLHAVKRFGSSDIDWLSRFFERTLL